LARASAFKFHPATQHFQVWELPILPREFDVNDKRRQSLALHHARSIAAGQDGAGYQMGNRKTTELCLLAMQSYPY
jgi:hypothetical protein